MRGNPDLYHFTNNFYIIGGDRISAAHTPTFMHSESPQPGQHAAPPGGESGTSTPSFTPDNQGNGGQGNGGHGNGDHTHNEWQELSGEARHHTVEVLRLIMILLQDSVILIAGFAVEYIAEHFLHSTQPFFQLAISISSAMFLLLYGVMVTVHVVNYVRKQFSATAASLFGQYLPWGLAAAGVIAAVIAFNRPGAHDSEQASTGHAQVSRFAITLPPGDRLATSSNSQALDLSQDGSRLVYGATHAGVQQLHVRGIDSMEAQPIRGTEGALSPFFSPDGQSVGFIVVPQIRKIAVSGGTPQNLTNVINDTGGVSWGPNDTIVFSYSAIGAIRAIPANGGTHSPLTTLKGENSHRWPQLLPGGKAVLFTNFVSSGDTSQILVERTDTRERKVLVQGGSFSRFVPTGHLLFVRAATLMAVPLDLDRLEVKGQAVPVVEGVMQTAMGAGQFSVSNSGTLAYVPGGVQGIDRTLVWVDRKGAETLLAAPLRAYNQPKLAPDGQHLAIQIESNIWIYDMVRGTLTRLTFEGGNLRPLWTPDGKRVAYQSTKSGKANLWWKPADGTGSEEQLTNSDFFFLPSSISPELVAAYAETHPDTNRDIYVVPLNGDRKQKPWLQTPFDETAPLFSPDGKWIAYISNESGRFEIYVRPASGTGGKWQISTEGGQAHAWNPNGKELFYQTGDKMFAVDINQSRDPRQAGAGSNGAVASGFSAGVPRLLFEGTYEKQAGVGANYNVSPDGQRFLMIKPGGVRQEGATQINVVLNWFEELRQKVPVP